MSYDSEADLVAELQRYVPTLWGSSARSDVEVPCHDSARMDLLVSAPSGVIAVEAKLSHFHRVLAQAFLHRYCVDYTYIAVPAEKLTEVIQAEASRFGIGVIVVSDSVVKIVSESTYLSSIGSIRERLIESLRIEVDSAEVV